VSDDEASGPQATAQVDLVPESPPSDPNRRLLEWAARARGNPNFDEGEREYRLAIARRAQEILDPGRKDTLVERVEGLRAVMASRVPQILLPWHIQHLLEWAAEDEHSLVRALEVFNQAWVSPEARVGVFAEHLRARAAPGDDPDPVALALGSLFAFATMPGELPMLRLSASSGLARVLGEQLSGGSIREQFARHVRFAGRMHEAFVGARIPVRDLIDTEALMLVIWEDRQFWLTDDDGRRPRKRDPRHYLAACAIYRDEAPYLAEWIEFHRLVGFERFYLYDNDSEDNHLDVLAPYIDEGIVVVHDWNGPHLPGQIDAYQHAISTYGDEARWIGCFDIDEFLFSPTHRPVSEVLRDYEQWPGVVVNAPRFGPSGHRTKPDGLVIESYLTHLQLGSDRTLKSVVDPAAVESVRSAHLFNFLRRSAVDENGYPVHHNRTKVASFERLRINHYYWKSEEEFLWKASHRTLPELGPGSPSVRRQNALSFEEISALEAERGVRDEAILHYVKPVRTALREHSAAQNRARG
jgi:Glycosyltransferase family 92